MSTTTPLDPPRGGNNATGLGSGHYVGDHLILTAGHVAVEANEEDDLADRQLRLIRDHAIEYDPRQYASAFMTRYAALSVPLPDVVDDHDYDDSNDPTISSQYIERFIRIKDIIFVHGDGTVDEDDDGLILYLDSNDIFQMNFGLTAGTQYRRWSTVDGTDSVTSVSPHSIGIELNIGSRPGSSGGGNWIRFEGRNFISGNTVSSGPNQSFTYTHSTRISKDEFYHLHDLMRSMSVQMGNVTHSEPTNLIVGSGGQDSSTALGSIGTFRADIILGRGGDDFIAGDPLDYLAWGDDQIFGGEGNDTISGGKGHNLLHGGDHRSYGGAARIALDSDGIDAVDYLSFALDVSGKSIVISFDKMLDPNYASTVDAASRVVVQVIRPNIATDIDALISIEKLYATDESDTIKLKGWSTAQVAGEDGQGGLATVDLRGGDDTIDGTGVTGGLSIDLVTGRVASRPTPALFVNVLNAENVIGSDSDDVINGNDSDNRIKGGGGTDLIDGRGGSDTLDYTGASAALLVVVWDSATSSWTVQAGSHGNDVVKNVESVEADAPVLILDIDGTPRPNDLINIVNINVAGQFFGNFAAMDGVTLYIGADRSGTALDSATMGGVNLSGVGTDIIGSAGNDSISDHSPDAKTISGGDGDDNILLGDGNALVFAGEGVDIVTSGAGDDIVIDVSTTAGTPGLAGWISTGAGNDRIVIGHVDQPNLSPVSVNVPFYIVDAGSGDDTVELDFYQGSVLYKAGGGTDTINTKLYYEYTYTVGIAPEHAVIAGPGITLDFSDYGQSSINAVFYRSSLIKLSDDEPNRDFGDWWMQLGTLVITYAGGTITIDNVGSIVSSPPPPNGDVPPSGTVAGLIGVGYIGGGTVQTTIVGDAQRPLPPAKDAVAPPSAEPVTTNEGDQTIVLKSGTHSYAGGSGVDRLIVSWDLASIAVGFDAGVLTIGDRWGKIGSTTLSNFDQIYVVADRKTYTPAEFYATYGSFGSTELLGDAVANVLTAGAGTDRLFGFEGADQLYGLGGNDFLDGGSGADTMRGGTGNDIYIVDNSGDVVKESANAGSDTVRSSVNHVLAANVENLQLLGTALNGTGNAEANRIDGNDLNNILSGLAGNDRLAGGDGSDSLYGGDGEDYLKGGQGDDLVYGEAGNDIMLGEAGSDTLDGGSGDDSLVGGSGADALAGGDGNDFLDGGDDGDSLRGGFGIDTLAGSGGADKFRFGTGDSGNTLATADVILDFDQLQGDRIMLGTIDAIVGGADDAFTFIGTSAFGNVAGQLRYELIGGNTYIMGDTDGDGASDFMIRLDGALVLTEADFSL